MRQCRHDNKSSHDCYSCNAAHPSVNCFLGENALSSRNASIASFGAYLHGLFGILLGSIASFNRFIQRQSTAPQIRSHIVLVIISINIHYSTRERHQEPEHVTSRRCVDSDIDENKNGGHLSSNKAVVVDVFPRLGVTIRQHKCVVYYCHCFLCSTA
jgi:hypothetical protein